MNRRKFTKHLEDEGCVLVREGLKHTVFFNPKTKQSSTVPRHNEIEKFLAKKICRDLGVKEVV